MGLSAEISEVAPTLADVLVDAEDQHLLAVGGWYVARTSARGGWYVQRSTGRGRNKRHHYLHRAIVGAACGLVVDHINGNGLDNRRANLRVCTQAQNSANARKSRRNTSGYKGVDWNAARGAYRARLCVDRVSTHLGYFQTAEEAHAAYCVAASSRLGAFSKTQ